LAFLCFKLSVDDLSLCPENYSRHF
jgi:hypothetical protein